MTTTEAPSFPPYMQARRAADYLGLSRTFLAKLRMKGGGPTYSKVGRAVLYRRAELDRWTQENERTSIRPVSA